MNLFHVQQPTKLHRYLFQNIVCGSDSHLNRPHIKKNFLTSGLCLAAREKDTNILVAVLLSHIMERNQKIETLDPSTFTHPGMIRFCRVIQHLNEAYDCFSNPKMQRILFPALLGIIPSYTNQGLAKRLIKMCKDRAISKEQFVKPRIPSPRNFS
ncbi:hypothetical protein SK128_003648 [Halocaridina rubra]|uniref:Uncharacterized protein n=1 Tax=Halocaridina rubra TaxID=373956 RepID=A0AAN8WUH3_HALRR